jgi:nucleoside-diphosphate-sugar epimerase
VSSTGVYGQSDGEWIDENSAAAPNREGGQICLDAESVLREFDIESQKLILRFAGIYGPDRIPNIRSLSNPTLTVPSNSFLNLIHVSDAAKIVRSILCDDLKNLQSELFLISDGMPVERRDFYRYCVALLGIELPEFIEPTAEELAISRFGSSKRITNQRILNETGYQFEFPSYHEGLSQILSKTDEA